MKPPFELRQRGASTHSQIGRAQEAARVAPARGPPLWDLPDARMGDFDPQAQWAPDYELDQRIAS